jgi:hypothetical protein
LFQGLFVLGFLILILIYTFSGLADVGGTLTASGLIAGKAAAGIFHAALPGVPAVYGSCAAALAVMEFLGVDGWRALMMPDILVGIAAAIGLKKGVAALFGFPGAILDAWKRSTESGCIAVGQSLAIYGAIVFLSLVTVGVWSGMRNNVKWGEFTEAAALGAFGLVYALRYVTYPGSFLHLHNGIVLVAMALVTSAAAGWAAGTAPDLVKLAVAAAVAFLSGVWCLESFFGSCSMFAWTELLVPLAAALPGGLLARLRPSQ